MMKRTRIISPVDGVVVSRSIDPGATVVASFQAPVLFVIAQDLRKMRVLADVDEADVGKLKERMEADAVVDAFPGDVFRGVVQQVRFSPNNVQGVITYPVIVSAPNPELKLLPGMTAKISFEVDQVADVVKVPSGALRYYPRREHVREEDRKLLDGAEAPPTEDDDQRGGNATQLTAREKVEAQRNRRRRHVWVQDGHLLRAVEIVRSSNASINAGRDAQSSPRSRSCVSCTPSMNATKVSSSNRRSVAAR